MTLKARMTLAATSALVALLPAGADAAPLLQAAAPGNTVYGDIVMSPNDDGSSNMLTLPFAVNFFGNSYSNFWVNNNGNVTFTGRESGYTPEPFPASSNPMIAPFWGDVDTRGTGQVSVGTVNDDTVIVTWNQVGYYSQNTDLRNDFQLVLRNKAGETNNAGDFDVEFRYNDLQWTAGEASGGVGGIWVGSDGAPAQAGYDAGDGVNFFTLPFSRTNDVIQLKNNTNVPAGGQAGLWVFSIRSGALPGASPDNPLLPIVVDGSFQFDFNIGDINQRISLDPPVAVGYDYEVQAGPGNFQTVQVDTLVGDGIYSLFADLNDDGIIDELTELLTSSLALGAEYAFGPGGYSLFRIGGIETGAMLDPNDFTAFVTTVSFTAAGTYQTTQTAITENVDVPEPAALSLLGLGAGLLGAARRRRARA